MIGLLVFHPKRLKEDFPSGVVGQIHVISFLVAQPSGCLALVSEYMYTIAYSCKILILVNGGCEGNVMTKW